ncbi:RNA polymerase sigma factor [Sphingobacterium hotanense]|uniref:RNA polymerase sigma factor n=1 Tax=Sphingobacterium hotanense TaxID=649196 RepID=UPI0021A4970B|nr:sigma-70 family RNA polymerase sigma factor [Sphingobacterium hotanense]MCT1525229.1 sigma-70 family RNA polymerase sigma factor [Sphingobacterium hotanense]
MKNQVDEQLLWEAFKQGDRHAFESIYHEYVHRLYVEVSKRISDQQVVEDLLQEMFLTLWERRTIYQPKGDIYPYLFGMAINRVLNYYRTNKRKPMMLQLWENMPEDLIGLDELSSAFKQAHTLELELLLDKAIADLPNRMKQVYKLRYEEKKSVAEIASLLSSSPHTVHNQLKEIRKRFVKTLKETSYFFL